MILKIKDITIGERHRKDIGRLDDLKSSIKQVGLLQPIVVAQDRRLIAGRRRIESCLQLGWVEIEAVVAHNLKDACDFLRAQRDENTCRKNFLPSELVSCGRALEEIESQKADERKGRRNDIINLQENFLDVNSGQTRDKVGQALGVSGKTYQTAKKVVEAAESKPRFADLIGIMDASSPHKALNILNKRIAAERNAKLNKRNNKLNQTATVILADPPWQFQFAQSPSREIENKYPTMTLDDIKALKVQTNEDAILFLWTPSPKLEEALQVIRAWGFEYKTTAIWDKEKIGMGYYFRQQHELLLIATKGKLPTPDPSNRPSSIIRAKRKEHSAKPEIVYELIEAMYPDQTKLELFARKKRKGWLSWGNQAGGKGEQ